MRFCPFCSADNPAEATHCASCSRKLPPVPPRRKRPTSIPVVAAMESAGSGPAQQSARGSTRAPPPPARDDRDRAAAKKRPTLRELENLVEASDEAFVPEAEAEPAAPAIPPPITRPRTDSVEPEVLAPARKIAVDDWGDPDDLEPLDEPAPSPRERTSGWETPPRETTSDWPTAPRDERSRRATTGNDDYTMPPTQIGSGEAISVDPVPEVPETGLVAAVKYLVKFLKARWQRRSAIRGLKDLIKVDTASLDAVLGVLGREVRALKVNNRVLEAENRAINEAEERKVTADREFSELQNKQAEENNRFAEIESDRDEKVAEAEAALEEAKNELGSYEAQRRGLREKRKDIDRRINGLIKNAESREAEAAKLEMGEPRSELRRAAEGLRRDAANIDPERQDLDRRLAALDRPLGKATAKVEALKAELESARRSLNDAREGHRHRLSEIEAERGRKSRELAQADAEIQRRLVTLGTLVNLNRIKRPEFTELYARIDVLRGNIGARTNEIDKLTVERGAYDKKTLIRGSLVLGAAFVVLCLILAIIIW